MLTVWNNPRGRGFWNIAVRCLALVRTWSIMTLIKFNGLAPIARASAPRNFRGPEDRLRRQKVKQETIYTFAVKCVLRILLLDSTYVFFSLCCFAETSKLCTKKFSCSDLYRGTTLTGPSVTARNATHDSFVAFNLKTSKWTQRSGS